MLAADLLAKKRDGEELTEAEIRFLIEGFCDDSVTDYQMSAFAMAVCLRGMTVAETSILTRAMLESGDVIDRSVSGDTPRVDKHSTGGLGDKVSLILAPLLAACGVHVPMVSGRGLGLTGGTLDKLEAIPGFQTQLEPSDRDQLLSDVGAFIVGADARVAPADRRLYALRDVTATVESVSLITASILSKKLAANLDALVMDVKAGGGAFMKTLQDATALAQSIESTGSSAGLPTDVLITDMDQPLGRTVGNANEVNESLKILRGEDRDDPLIERVRELTIELCALPLVRVGKAEDLGTARQMLATALESGAAMERFEAMVSAQGGRLGGELPLTEARPVLAEHAGYVAAFDCRLLGQTVVAMGGGRRKMGDPIDPAVGIEVHVQIGDVVAKGQPILSLHCHERSRSEYADSVGQVVTISEEHVSPTALIYPGTGA
ncbi:MAG: thymidine phosphorylase [Planctomycetota bacterium]